MYYIYGTSSCKYCDMAKELLDIRNEEYSYQDVSMDQALIDIFKVNGWKTVPQIFKDDKHIGGYTDLVEYLEYV